MTKSIAITRLNRLRAGNFGDCKRLKNGNGVYELRIDFGLGYRVYFGKQSETIVVLLVGGDKGSQTCDVVKAQQYWLDFKEQNYG